MQGWLYKTHGTIKKIRKRRYLILLGVTIYYFADSKGNLLMCCCTNTLTNLFCKTKKIWVLCD